MDVYDDRSTVKSIEGDSGWCCIAAAVVVAATFVSSHLARRVEECNSKSGQHGDGRR